MSHVFSPHVFDFGIDGCINEQVEHGNKLLVDVIPCVFSEPSAISCFQSKTSVIDLESVLECEAPEIIDHKNNLKEGYNDGF